jgi:hypothetical protein
MSKVKHPPNEGELIAKKSDKIKAARVNVNLEFSYTSESKLYENIFPRLNNQKSIVLNDLIEELVEHKNCKSILDTSVSYYDEDIQVFIYCGVYPFNCCVTIPYNHDENTIPTIRLKSRIIIVKENLMRMELIEENNQEIDENNQNIFINHKSKRSKERKIGYIIEKVFLWRKLYNGFTDERGNLIKLTLEEAAEKVGISKKSLDDYLIQLR